MLTDEQAGRLHKKTRPAGSRTCRHYGLSPLDQRLLECLAESLVGSDAMRWKRINKAAALMRGKGLRGAEFCEQFADWMVDLFTLKAIRIKLDDR